MELTNAKKVLTSEYAIKSIIERHLLRQILEALFAAEWEYRGHLMHGSETVNETICVRTALGRMRVVSPKNPASSNAFRSALLQGHKNGLKIEISKLMALPFTDDSELRPALAEVYGEELPDNFVHSFGKHFTNRLQATQEQALYRDWVNLYVGTSRLSKPNNFADELELDYCIGVTAALEYRVIGLWDPKSRSVSRWQAIKSELKARGLHQAQCVYTDNSAGLADIFLEMISPEMKDLNKLADVKIPETTILLTRVISDVPDMEEIAETPIYISPEIAAARHHRSALSLTFSCAALGLLVMAAGFYQSTRVAVVPAEASAPEARAGENIAAALAQPASAIERQLFSEMTSGKAPAESLPSLIRVASLSDNKHIVDALVGLTTHPDAIVRVSVAKALAPTGKSLTLERKQGLYRLLNDPDYLVRGFAVKAIARSDAADARDTLRKALAVEDNEMVRALITRLVQ